MNIFKRSKHKRLIIGFLILLFFVIGVYYFIKDHYHSSSSSSSYNVNKNTILIFGGAGYIGSHVLLELIKERKYKIIVFDNFDEGFRKSLSNVEKLTGTKISLFIGDINNEKDVKNVFKIYKPEVVFHLCAKISVPESVKKPLEYYDNNIGGTINILKEMNVWGVKYFVFSSTAAIFGEPEPENIPIVSSEKTKPINPYGESKLIIEMLLKNCDKAYGIKSVSLRYFNAAGADESGKIGESHKKETHLIPLILQVPLGKREKIFVYGDDYPTKDGTCVRDYIHVTDIARAHIKSLEYLVNMKGETEFLNLGNGKGYSVLEVIQACEEVVGMKIEYGVANRREGDPPALIASSKRAEHVLGWTQKYPDIKDIVRTAYNWHRNNINGYKQ